MLRLTIFVLALSAGAAAAWLATAAQTASPPATAEVVSAPKIALEEVLVASVEIAQGDPITEGNIRWQSWPREAVSGGAILRSDRPDAITEFAGSSARARFVAGEPILEDKLAARGAGYLSANLTAGKRAVAVRITAENTAGGFILPNDRVDVIHTLTLQGADAASSRTLSRTILQNVLVLAIDQMAEDAKADSLIGKTATLELDVGQVEAVTAAQASGMLSLALRPVSDTSLTISTPQTPMEAKKTIRIRRAGAVEVVEIN